MDKPQTDFIILESDSIQNLVNEVRKQQEDGWQALGSIVTDEIKTAMGNRVRRFYQSMVLYL